MAKPLQSNPSAAEALFRRALEQDPSFVSARVALVSALLNEGRLDESVALGAEMVEKYPAQRLGPLGFRREDVLDVFGQDPVTHCGRARTLRRRS